MTYISIKEKRSPWTFEWCWPFDRLFYVKWTDELSDVEYIHIFETWIEMCDMAQFCAMIVVCKNHTLCIQ